MGLSVFTADENHPLRGEEVPDHTADRWKEVGALRISNSAKIDRFGRMGVELDLALPRVEHFMKFLYDAGLISASQRVDEALSWEKGLDNQLDEIAMRLDAQRKEAQKPKLVVPGAPLPGGNRAQRRRRG